MWSKIKSSFMWIAGIIIGVLLFILNIKNKKIDKLEDENKVKDVVIKEAEISRETESKHSENILNIKNKVSETSENVASGEISYNDVVKEWNESN